MGSIRGLRCDHCHTEVLATASHAAVIGGAAWTYPVLCCGQPLRPLETGQVLSTTLPRRRVARCGRCGYEVCVIVHPARVLVCAIWPTSGNGAKNRVSVFYACFDDRQTIATAAPGRASASEPAFRNFLSGKRKDAERSDHPRGAVGRSLPDAALIPQGR